jgi:DNA-binding response OmpR family regulator
MTTTPPLRRSLHILIVDDEAEVREIVAEYLRAAGHVVRLMASGREALDHIGQTLDCYDVALIDWRMPGISGRDVIQGIRHQCPNTRVVIATGELSDNLRFGRDDIGAVEVLRKPFSLRELNERLGRVAPAAPWNNS